MIRALWHRLQGHNVTGTPIHPDEILNGRWDCSCGGAWAKR